MTTLVCQRCEQRPWPDFQSQSNLLKTMKSRYGNFAIEDSCLQRVRGMKPLLLQYAATLKDELEAAQEAIENLSTLMAPIRQVPNEILGKIFDLYASSSTFDTNAIRQVGPSVLLSRISLVCKGWRDIIVSTKSFWTTIFLPSLRTRDQPSQSSKSVLHGFLPFLNLQFQRAADLPLTLTSSFVVPVWGHADKPPVAYNSLFIRLGAYYSCITKVDIGISINAIPVLAYCSMPALRILRLHITSSDWAGNTPRGDSIFLPQRNFPSLTDVTLLIDCQLDQLSLPWSQFTSFQLMTSSPPQAFDPFSIVHHLTNIKFLDISFNHRPPENHHPEQTTIDLSCLNTLVLSIQFYEITSVQFFQRLKASKLNTLSLKGGWPCNILLYVAYTYPTLVSLDMSPSNWTPGPQESVTIDALYTLVNLEKFHCYSCNPHDITRLILHELRGRDARGGHNDQNTLLFPRLKDLYLGCLPFNEHLDVLQGLVQERMSRISVAIEQRRPLRTVRIDYQVRRYSRLVKPPGYNDWTTSLRISSHFSKATVKEMMNW